MNNFIVDSSKPYSINFNPENTVESVLQNVATTLSVTINSAVNSRGLGIADNIDELTTVAAALIKQDILSAIELGEPRAIVEQISVTADNTGKINAKVTISI